MDLSWTPKVFERVRIRTGHAYEYWVGHIVSVHQDVSRVTLDVNPLKYPGGVEYPVSHVERMCFGRRGSSGRYCELPWSHLGHGECRFSSDDASSVKREADVTRKMAKVMVGGPLQAQPSETFPTGRYVSPGEVCFVINEGSGGHCHIGLQDCVGYFPHAYLDRSQVEERSASPAPTLENAVDALAKKRGTPVFKEPSLDAPTGKRLFVVRFAVVHELVYGVDASSKQEAIDKAFRREGRVLSSAEKDRHGATATEMEYRNGEIVSKRDPDPDTSGAGARTGARVR